MSAPARRMRPRPDSPTGRSTSAPARTPATRVAPTPARSPARHTHGPARRATTPRRVQTSGAAHATRRKPHHLGFAILSSAVIGVMVFGIVVLHVLLAQQSFRLDGAQRRIETLGTEHLGLVRDQATLSAPGRIAAWATRHGMRLPDDIRILRAPKASVDPAGAGTGSTSATSADATDASVDALVGGDEVTPGGEG